MVSIESLLCEVNPLLEVQLTLKAADELFFGDKLLYHYCSNEGPMGGGKSFGGRHEAEHHKGKNKNKKGKGHEENLQEKPTELSHDRSDGLRNAIANAKETLRKALEDTSGDAATDALTKLTDEVATLRKMSDDMKGEIERLRKDFQNLLQCVTQQSGDVILPPFSQKQPTQEEVVQKPTEAPEDDFDLFGSSDEEEEDAEKERIKQERLKAYAEKKAKKSETIAKSSVILDVKPWDDTTDMGEMEKLVRAIEKDGLVWGGAKLIPLAYGIKVLQIICVVEDDKVSVDDLIDQITEEISDYVQSVDIVAFNKI